MKDFSDSMPLVVIRSVNTPSTGSAAAFTVVNFVMLPVGGITTSATTLLDSAAVIVSFTSGPGLEAVTVTM